MAAGSEIDGFSTPGRNRKPPQTSVSKVRVVVRLRPFLPQDISSTNESQFCCVSLQESRDFSDDEVTVLLKDRDTRRSESFKLDAFFGHGDNNVSQIFDQELGPLIPGIFQGRNATVFAYGATGSGKTYTMQGSEEVPGLMRLAVSAILSICKRTGSRTALSYYEIYLDKCYDLLEPKEKEISVLNDKDGQIHLKGLAQIEVESTEKFHDIFSSVLQRRKVAQTQLNDESSRSHGVLVITVSSPSQDGSSKSIIGKLNLIDLAGNEDNKMTNNEGIRLQESAKINQSLLTLSNVIHALNNCQPRIPYRESKLTRILQDSLGGTSRALMIACLNPGRYHECVHTLSLASRSRCAVNISKSDNKCSSLSVKVDMEAKLAAWLESKGKIRSVQRSSVKANREQGISNSKQRSLYEAKRNLFKEAEHSEPMISKDENYDADAVTNEVESIIPDNDDILLLHGVTSSPPITPQRTGLSLIDRNAGTPLDKFTSTSCRLKSTLINCYLEFLNTASREELTAIKGIGQKLADYIAELRETSPLQSLQDIEKLGLSSKQVHNLFRKAARDQLEKI